VGIHGIRHLRGGSSGVVPVGSWDASTSTLALLAALVSHSRTSLATMFDSTGKLTYAPNNLLLQSNTFSNAAWGKFQSTIASGVSDPLGGTAASTLTATSAGGYVLQSLGSQSGNFVVAFWVKRRTGSGPIEIASPSGVGTVIAVTNAWTQFYLTGAVSGTAYAQIKISTNGDAVDIYAATLSAVTYETTPRTADQVITTSSAYYGPRIDYDPNTLAVKGLLIEEARTNTQFPSTPDPGAWGATACTLSTNAGAAPDGTSTASSINDGATTAVHFINKSASSLTSSGNVASTIFVRAGTGRYITLSGYGTSNVQGGYATFDLNTGAVTQSGNAGTGTLVSAAATQFGAAWRLTIVTSAAADASGRQFVVSTANAGTFSPDIVGRQSYAGGSNTWFVWGAQQEAGSNSTSLIPTTTAAVTRAADVVQFTGPALTALQGSAGSAIVQMADQSVGYSALGGAVLGGSSTYWLDLASGNMYSNSGSHLLNTANAAIAGSPYRAGVAWNASGRSLAMNGGTVATDAFGGWAATTPYLGSLSGTANFANGHVASFAIYNQRLPDGTLQSKSVVGASY